MGWESAILVGVIGISIIWAYIGFNLDKQHDVVRILLILMALGNTLLGYPFIKLVIEANTPTGQANLITLSETGMAVTIYPMIFILFWFVIFVILRTGMLLMERARDVKMNKKNG